MGFCTQYYFPFHLKCRPLQVLHLVPLFYSARPIRNPIYKYIVVRMRNCHIKLFRIRTKQNNDSSIDFGHIQVKRK